jgi:leucyl-tRNA synthetase
VEGSYRFLNRIWRLMVDLQADLSNQAGMPNNQSTVSARVQDLRRLTHRTIKRVTDDIEREFQFNTAIAALMEFVNGLYKFTAERDTVAQPGEAAALREAVHTLILLLAPFAPHAAEELWALLGGTPSVAGQPWPQYDPALILSDRLTIPIQVNGKLRSKIDVPADWTEEQVLAQARRDEKITEWLGGKAPAKTIYVPKKLINFVIR